MPMEFASLSGTTEAQSMGSLPLFPHRQPHLRQLDFGRPGTSIRSMLDSESGLSVMEAQNTRRIPHFSFAR